MVVARSSTDAAPVDGAARLATAFGGVEHPATSRRVRHEVADGAAVVVFSLGTSVVLAVLLGLALHLAG